MTSASLSLTELIDRVEAGPGGRDALDLLVGAISLSQEVLSLGDSLVMHFVDQARRAGHSWTVIGDRLGVSKQAARKRFGAQEDPRSSAETLTPRLRACLCQAGEEARLDGSDEIGTHHLLRGLLLEGVGAASLEKLGVTGTALRGAGVRLFGEDGPPSIVAPPESDEAGRALAAAASIARDGDHNYVGTEHLLFVLASDPGSRSRRLLNDLGVSVADVKRELEGFVRPCKNRRRRRGKQEMCRCSFCGKGDSGAVRLVAGPSVWICSECVRLSAEILALRDPST